MPYLHAKTSENIQLAAFRDAVHEPPTPYKGLTPILMMLTGSLQLQRVSDPTKALEALTQQAERQYQIKYASYRKLYEQPYVVISYLDHLELERYTPGTRRFQRYRLPIRFTGSDRVTAAAQAATDLRAQEPPALLAILKMHADTCDLPVQNTADERAIHAANWRVLREAVDGAIRRYCRDQIPEYLCNE